MKYMKCRKKSTNALQESAENKQGKIKHNLAQYGQEVNVTSSFF
jgi:hypothetical protein